MLSSQKPKVSNFLLIMLFLLVAGGIKAFLRHQKSSLENYSIALSLFLVYSSLGAERPTSPLLSLSLSNEKANNARAEIYLSK
jgi:hypothetical protein